MYILTINAGSSSLRIKLYKKGQKEEIAFGHLDGIGLKSCRLIFKSEEKNIGIKSKIKTHKAAVKKIISLLPNHQIKVIGHRVVHGGEK